MFAEAKPVWLKDKEKEVNCRVQFKALCPKCENAVMRIATSGVYQLWINGNFVSFGPARAGENHFRMDEIALSSYLTKAINVIVIEVGGYYCNSFYVMRQPSFLQAEIVSGATVIAKTGKDFTARINPCYEQKIQRYSYQRTFAESYTACNIDDFFTNENIGKEALCTLPTKNIINRKAPYPLFEKAYATPFDSGNATKITPAQYHFDRYCANVGMGDTDLTGWEMEQLDALLEKEYQQLSFAADSRPVTGKVLCNRYEIYRFDRNLTGMLALKVSVKKDSTLYLSFDEISEGKHINPTRCDVCNIIKYKLPKGEHILHTFEVYTMQYLQVTCLEGECDIRDVHLVEYKHPPIEIPHAQDEVLQKITDAALETYRQNAVDLFTDCPSRERAGWLCDSYFLARAEYALTGKNTVEECFLENFLHADTYGTLPDGMVPMCYPANHRTGNYIPSWSLFLIAELKDYFDRTGNEELPMSFKEKVYGILRFFEAFENGHSLLENLQGWVFVEWSRANDADLVQGINYPNNMMYYYALKCAGQLYDDARLVEKAEGIRAKIIEQSFDGRFFVDHADVVDGKVQLKPESTEVCQYYAFFTGVATPQSHPELFDRLVNEFGPDRDVKSSYPEIWPAAPFIGNYLRLQILLDNGFKEMVLQNIKGYFIHMAERTGTLWEHAGTNASCNHGFASAVLYWLKQIDL